MIALRKSPSVKLLVGGEPRVELLPREVALRASRRSTRRSLVGVVVLAVLVSIGAFGAATTVNVASQASLETEQGKTSAILAEQAKYGEVTRVEAELATATAARRSGASTEIDWRSYVEAVRAKMPGGVDIRSFSIVASTPLQPVEQSEGPLQGARVATIVFDAVGDSLPEIQAWLTSLESLTGFVDASPGSIVTDQETAGYAVTVTMHIGSDALENRFVDDTTEEEK